jgi:hypothetical protein
VTSAPDPTLSKCVAPVCQPINGTAGRIVAGPEYDACVSTGQIGPYNPTADPTVSSTAAGGGSLTFYINVHVSVVASVCLGYNTVHVFGVNTGIPDQVNWVDFSETYTESLVANASVSGAGSFDLSNLNGPPKELASIPIVENEAICCGPVPIIWLGLVLNISAEYQLTFDQGSWVNVTQGSYGALNQNYSFGTGLWTDSNPVSCIYGTSSNACTSITLSPSFGGSALFRIGPQLALNLSAGLDFISLVGVTVWAYLYGQASLYYGMGSGSKTVGQDQSDGACGSQYAVWGVALDGAAVSGAAGSEWWGVLCAGVGVQFGGTWWGGCINLGIVNACLFQGSLFTTTTVPIYGAPLASTVNVYDLTQESLTPTFTNNVPVQSLYSWTMTSGTQNYLLPLSALAQPGANPPLGMSWSQPVEASNPSVPCGSLTGPVGEVEFTAPMTSTGVVCQITLETNLPVSDQSFQVSSITVDIDVVSYHVGDGVVVAAKCPVEVCTIPLSSINANGLWRVSLTATGPCPCAAFSANSTSYGLRLTNVTAGTYAYVVTPRAGLSVSPSNGTFKVNGTDGNTFPALTFEPLTVEFSETGLPSNATWSVQIDGTNETASGGTAVFTTSDGVLEYTVDPPAGYSVAPSNSGSVVVNGTDRALTLHFVAMPGGSVPPRGTLVHVTSVGLPMGSVWTLLVTPGLVVSGTSGTLGETVANGSYTWVAVGPAGYVATSTSGSFVASGGSYSTNVSFHAVRFGVRIAEIGLPPATPWHLTINGVTHSVSANQFYLTLTNGSHSFSIKPIPGYTALWGGDVVVDGANLSEVVDIHTVSYAVGFNASGLAPGKIFTATLGGVTHSVVSTGKWEFLIWWGDITNGTYTYTIGKVAGYNLHPVTGTLTVNGSAVEDNVSFVGKHYNVTFSESGLPSGAKWTVRVGNDSVSSRGGTAVFGLPDGTYWFNATATNSKYIAAPEEGKFLVDDGAVSIGLTYQKVTGSVVAPHGGGPDPPARTAHGPAGMALPSRDPAGARVQNTWRGAQRDSSRTFPRGWARLAP